MSLPFQPLPGLRNPHLQTLIGHWFPGRLRLPSGRRLIFQLPDQDQIALHINHPPHWMKRRGLAVLIHGMGGSAQSRYMKRVMYLLIQQGCLGVRVDLRGCGHSLSISKRPAHGGCSQDVLAVLQFLHQSYPHLPIVLAGFSLGGNIVLKAMAESKAAGDLDVAAAVAVNAPIDMAKCSQLLEMPRNRIYETFFMRDLWQLAFRRQFYFPDQPPPRWSDLQHLRDFDEQYTAPLNGFRNAGDYYAQASSYPLIKQIGRPTLLLTARDDPFIAVEPYEAVVGLPSVQVVIAPHGGHLGFLGHDGAGGIRWMEQTVVRWLMGHLQ